MDNDNQTVHGQDCRCNQCSHIRECRPAESCSCEGCLRFLASCRCLECYYALLAACRECRKATISYQRFYQAMPQGRPIPNDTSVKLGFPDRFDFPLGSLCPAHSCQNPATAGSPVGRPDTAGDAAGARETGSGESAAPISSTEGNESPGNQICFRTASYESRRQIAARHATPDQRTSQTQENADSPNFTPPSPIMTIGVNQTENVEPPYSDVRSTQPNTVVSGPFGSGPRSARAPAATSGNFPFSSQAQNYGHNQDFSNESMAPPQPHVDLPMVPSRNSMQPYPASHGNFGPTSFFGQHPAYTSQNYDSAGFMMPPNHVSNGRTGSFGGPPRDAFGWQLPVSSAGWPPMNMRGLPNNWQAGRQFGPPQYIPLSGERQASPMDPYVPVTYSNSEVNPQNIIL